MWPLHILLYNARCYTIYTTTTANQLCANYTFSQVKYFVCQGGKKKKKKHPYRIIQAIEVGIAILKPIAKLHGIIRWISLAVSCQAKYRQVIGDRFHVNQLLLFNRSNKCTFFFTKKLKFKRLATLFNEKKKKKRNECTWIFKVNFLFYFFLPCHTPLGQPPFPSSCT